MASQYLQQLTATSDVLQTYLIPISDNPASTGRLKKMTVAQLGTGLFLNVDAIINGHNIGRGAFSNDSNLRIGIDSLANNVSGTSNLAIGPYALANTVSSVGLVGVGYGAGSYLLNGSTPLTDSDNGIYIGNDTRASANNVSHEIVIGSGGRGIGAGTTVIGTTNSTAFRAWGTPTFGPANSLTFGLGSLTAPRTLTIPDVSSTLLVASNIGVTVQAHYDVLNTIGTLVAGVTGAGTIVLSDSVLGPSDIGVSVQGYDASTTILGNTTTGAGSIVRATSPTLVTPVLGAATATSLVCPTFSTSSGAMTFTPATGSDFNVAGTTGITWGSGVNSLGLATLGTGGTTGGSLWVNTASLSSVFHSGLGITGTYGTPTLRSVVNINAYGVNSAGGYGSDLAFSTTSNTTLTERMRINYLGNVGIGVAAPLYPLHVNLSSGDNQLYVSSGTPSSIAGDSYLTLGSSRADTGVGHVCKIRSVAVAIGKADLAFLTQPSNGVYTERMRIDNTGNVGIGTTSPQSKLQVTATETVASAGVIQIGGGASASYGILVDYAAVNSGRCSITQLNNTGGSAATIAFGFGAISSGFPTNTVATLTQAGNVGIGTTSPSARLHAISTTEQLRVGYDASNYYSATVSSAGAVTFDAVGASSGFTFSDTITVSTATPLVTFQPTVNTQDCGLKILNAAGSAAGYLSIIPNTIGTSSKFFMYVGGAAAADIKLTVDDDGVTNIKRDASNYLTITPSSVGLITFDAVGSSAAFRFSDSVGIGMTPTYLVDILSPTLTDFGSQWVVRARGASSCTTNGTNYMLALDMDVSDMSVTAGVTDSGYRMGVRGNAITSTTGFAGTLATQHGVSGRAGISSATSGAVVTNAYALSGEILNSVAGTTITNAMGLYISNVGTTGTITQRYGVYVATATGGKNYFSHAIGIGISSPTASLHTLASTTSMASLCLPHGSAPTTPVNGDMWTTTAGLFVRINGVTTDVGGTTGSSGTSIGFLIAQANGLLL